MLDELEQPAAVDRRALLAVKTAPGVSRAGTSQFGMVEPSLALQYSTLAGNTRLSPAGSACVGRSCRQGFVPDRCKTGLNWRPSTPATEDQPEPAEIRVVLLVGMGGGTGSGMAIDLANAVRSRMQASGRRAQVQGVFVCTCLGNTNASPLSVANTYALLTELQFVSAFGNQGTHSESNGLRQLESRHRPFDLVYCVKTKHHADESVDDGLGLIAQQMLLWHQPMAFVKCCSVANRLQLPESCEDKSRSCCERLAAPRWADRSRHRIDRLARYLAQRLNYIGLTMPLPTTGGGSIAPAMLKMRHRKPTLQAIRRRPRPSGQVHPGPRLRWRHGFGGHSSTRFAYEVVSRICRPSALRGIGRTKSFSSRDPARLIGLASQAISSISTRVAASSQFGDPLSDEDEVIVNKLASNGNCVLTKLIDEIDQLSADLPYDAARTEQVIVTECVAAVQECLNRQAPDAALDSNSAMRTNTQHVLDSADVDLLQCGYDRRTLIVVPSKDKRNDAIDALTNARPTAAIVPVDVDESVVFCEGSGVSPSSLARGFERVYPGIAEAARRLFTRIDIDWSLGDDTANAQ